MKKLTFILLIFVFSCKKKEPQIYKKSILELRAASEYLLGLKSDENYIGLQYFKNYTDKDEVTVTFNNQKATLLSETNDVNDRSTNMLFKLPKTNEPGDFKINIIIKNNQNSTEAEGIFRIVDDYSLNNVWNSLDRSYLNTRYFYIDKMKDYQFTLRPVYFKNENIAELGVFMENLGNFNTYTKKLFIWGLPGKYTATYNGNNIQQLNIINGDKIVDINFDVTKFYTELESVYGHRVAQTEIYNKKISTFKTGNYTLTVTETPELVSTAITKN